MAKIGKILLIAGAAAAGVYALSKSRVLASSDSGSEGSLGGIDASGIPQEELQSQPRGGGDAGTYFVQNPDTGAMQVSRVNPSDGSLITSGVDGIESTQGMESKSPDGPKWYETLPGQAVVFTASGIALTEAYGAVKGKIKQGKSAKVELERPKTAELYEKGRIKTADVAERAPTERLMRNSGIDTPELGKNKVNFARNTADFDFSKTTTSQVKVNSEPKIKGGRIANSPKLEAEIPTKTKFSVGKVAVAGGALLEIAQASSTIKGKFQENRPSSAGQIAATGVQGLSKYTEQVFSGVSGLVYRPKPSDKSQLAGEQKNLGWFATEKDLMGVVKAKDMGVAQKTATVLGVSELFQNSKAQPTQSRITAVPSPQASYVREKAVATGQAMPTKTQPASTKPAVKTSYASNGGVKIVNKNDNSITVVKRRYKGKR